MFVYNLNIFAITSTEKLFGLIGPVKSGSHCG